MVDLILSQRRHVVLTPHSSEMAAMLDVTKEYVEADPQRVATRIASRLGAVVALKGATTFIADPTGQVW
jgi:ADP-dependent NAD(P)H-hydrate dehydratase